jgi:hypothetical protein
MKVHVNSVFFGISELLVKSGLWKMCALIRGGTSRGRPGETIPMNNSERQGTTTGAPVAPHSYRFYLSSSHSRALIQSGRKASHSKVFIE